MSVHVLDAMSREGFEEVLALHDRDSGLRAFLAVHDTSAGPAFGGVRRHAYPSEAAALLDALRLSLAMSFKCALAGVPGGGGKLVVLDRPDLDPRAAYRAIGARVERLGGRFYTGPDLGTGPRECAWLAEATRYATRPGPEGPGDLAGATAAGVFAGLAAGLRRLDGAEDWPRRTVVVQGLGSVGLDLARRLVERGVRVLGSDLDEERVAEAGRTLGVQPVEPGREVEVEADVLSPCAMGGVLHDVTIPRLRARCVAGAANNQLARSLHAERLHERGVLFVPDFAINAGALLRGARFHLSGEPASDEEIESRVGDVADELLARAAEEDAPPARVAVREARRRIEARRAAARDRIGDAARQDP